MTDLIQQALQTVGQSSTMTEGEKRLMLKLANNSEGFERHFIREGVIKIKTNALDYLNDCMVFYHVEGKGYTDDGYFRHELEINGLSDERIKQECENIANWFFAEYKDEEFWVKETEENPIVSLIQIGTAVSQVIISNEIGGGNQ